MFDTPRVTERVYHFDPATGTYLYAPIKEVVTLMIARPNLNVAG